MTHIPQRMCVACREHKPAADMIRITVKDNTATLDGDNKNFARGAYICRKSECIAKAQKKHIIERHLKCRASDDLYSKAVEQI